jgi:hypothetical protein
LSEGGEWCGGVKQSFEKTKGPDFGWAKSWGNLGKGVERRSEKRGREAREKENEKEKDKKGKKGMGQETGNSAEGGGGGGRTNYLT